jgi:rfaE bifunctional protein kinase chain/domain
VLGPEAIAATREIAKARPVTADSRYQLASFAGVTVAKPNEPELAAATGLPIGSVEKAERAAKALLKRLRAEAVLVTRGREGMVLVTARGVDRIEPHGRREAIDVTGAGDTVISTLTLGLALTGSLLACARLANVAGGLVVQKPGTATVTVDELEQALAEKP